jgi:hypothetical protein
MLGFMGVDGTIISSSLFPPLEGRILLGVGGVSSSLDDDDAAGDLGLRTGEEAAAILSGDDGGEPEDDMVVVKESKLYLLSTPASSLFVKQTKE